MKHVSSVFAFACCIAAAPAWAQDSAKIAQGGAGNSAMIEQIATAGNNMARVHQGEGWQSGSGNHAQLMQRAVDSSRIDVMQSGFNNQYSVHQYDGSNLQANVNTNSGMYGQQGGEGNSIQISQSGSNAMAWVEQGGSMNSRVDIWQSGWDGQKMADVWQSGSSNQAMVNQHGGSSQASVHQAGSNLNASITQGSNGYGYGHGNTAHIRQGF